jgi:hypothetical protein
MGIIARILLLAFHLLTSRGSGQRSRGWAHR